MISTSRFAMCESSCASTPSISAGSSRFQRPVVTATAACFGERPVAKAFGTGVSMIAILRLRQVGHRAQALDHVVQRRAPPRGSTIFAPEARERELVGGEVLEEREPDDDQEHRDEPDVQDVEQDDGEDDVEQAEQAAREEHARREAGVTAIGAAFHGGHGTAARSG